MIATHYQIDFSEHYLADYMATRGIELLGWNTRFRGFESSFLLDHALVAEIASGSAGCAKSRGWNCRLVWGTGWPIAYGRLSVTGCGTERDAALHSGTATGSGPLTRPSLADGYVAHWSPIPDARRCSTARMDAAVVDENDPVATAPATSTCSTHQRPAYSPEFVAEYRRAQTARNHAITDWAETELNVFARRGFPTAHFP